MRNVHAAVSAIAAAIVMSGASAQAATILDVGTNDGCGKGTCFDSDGVFTQTWSAKGATGPMTIGKFLMDRGVLGNLDGSTFRISFQAGGQELGSWGSYNMAGIGGDELSFDGFDFVWNPEDGDLTLVLEIVKPKTGTGGGLGLSSGDGGPTFQALRGNDPDPPSDDGFELDGVSGDLDVSAIPEPGAWALMITGFGMAGGLLRQRRRVVA